MGSFKLARLRFLLILLVILFLIGSIGQISHTVVIAEALSSDSGIRVPDDETELGTAHLTRDAENDLQNLDFFGAELEDSFYFTVAAGYGYFELWRTDGTSAETTLIRDGPGQVNQLTAIGDKLFFFGDSENLWVSDGTTTGTIFLKSFFNPGGEALREFVDVDGTLFFAGADLSFGMGLWKSDGTPSGTQLVKDFRMDVGSYPRELTNVNGTLFFVAWDDIYGAELWKSDGTEAGTIRLTDQTGHPSGLTAFGNELMFFRNGLWKTDGTPGGTVLVSLTGASYTYAWQRPAVVGGFLFFSIGSELWKSDGTGAGTEIVVDLQNEPNIRYLTDYFGELIFSGEDSQTIWKSDGTAAGTILLAQTKAYTGFTVSDNLLYFLGSDEEHGEEVWRSDGTPTGTGMVIDLEPGPEGCATSLHKFGVEIVFSCSDEETSLQLWLSDGTPVGTKNFFSLQYESASSNYVFTGSDESLFYSHTTREFDHELWKSDGTELGTERVYPLSVAGFENPSNFSDWQGDLYFSAESRNAGEELWKSDGTPSGTVLVKDISPGTTRSSPERLTPGQEVLYFTARPYDPIMRGLWKTDGTPAGTVLIRHFEDFGDVNDPMVEINGVLFFVARDSSSPAELWKSDGTNSGTVPVKDIWPDNWSNLRFLTAVNDILYFSASDDVHGQELWRSDGTQSGTYLVKDIFPGAEGSYPYWFLDVGGQLFFIADDGIHGIELWTSNGTPAGTHLVLDIYPGEMSPFGSFLGSIYGNYFLSSFTNLNGELFFVAEDGAHGFELWASDGTPGGTRMVKDINPVTSGLQEPFRSDLRNMPVLGERLYFVADDNETGFEIWSTDGTEVGTIREQEIIPGPQSAFPELISVLEPNIFFTADDRLHGRELWALPYAVDLRIMKEVDPVPARSGQLLTYRILVSNSGLPTSQIELGDALPAQLSDLALVSSPTGCQLTQSTLLCEIGALAEGKNLEIFIEGFPTATGELTNTVQISLAEADVNLSNNTSTAVNTVLPPDLRFACVLSDWCRGRYQDDFSNPASGWPDLQYTPYSAGYRDGAYQVSISEPYYDVLIHPGIGYDQAIVEFDVANSTGADGSYGLVFEMPESGYSCGMYSFEITPGQEYGLFQLSCSSFGWEVITMGTSARINPGAAGNHIRVEHFGTRYRILVNQQLLVEFEDYDTLEISYLGWSVFTYETAELDIRYDNFKMCGAIATPAIELNDQINLGAIKSWSAK